VSQRLASALLLGLLASTTGCAGARLDALEAQVTNQALELSALRARKESSEVPVELFARSLKEPPDLQPELAALRARVAKLELELANLRDRPPTTEVDPGAPKDVLIPRPGQRPAPKPGAEIEVLSVGAGDLLLGRIGGELERLTLAGVQAPLRSEDYRANPSLEVRHREAFGAARLSDDRAWSQSRDFLFAKVQGKRFRLRYARRGRAADGSLSVLLNDGSRDLNAELVAAGLALAKGERYRAEEKAARAARQGLFSR
tara:strand:+ start:81 stop:857 length:777 start_codon:yes stop_codon:yes gene_type:complete